MAFSIDCLGKKSKNFDKKIYKFAFLFTITLILIIFLSSETSAKTISVAKDGSGNYEKIQTAINNSQNGDTITVKNGIYQENIIINKIISLNGQDKEKTVIDANNHEDGIKIEANWVNISNFRITNCGENDFDSGIEIRSSNVQVTNCSISDNKGYGIYLKKSDNNKIANCSINNNSDGGIYMDECLGNIIRDCNFLNNPSNGIHLSDSSLNQISHNLINNNTGKGISFYFYSSNNLIKNNIISNNSVNGIKIYYESSSNNIYKNDFIFNEKHAFDECENNWNSSDSGNFWSGFFKEDKNEDGYIDMPYGIQGAGNQDNFPYFNSINSKFPPIISHTKIENVNEGNSVSIICSFKSVKNIKGPKRPLVPEEERIIVLSALEMIDLIVLFDEETPIDLIGKLKPDVQVKGGDYEKRNLPEYSTIIGYGGKVEIIKFREGCSTTGIIEKVIKIYGN